MRVRYSIAGKLILYFAFFLFLFSVITGTIFWLLLSRHTTALHKQELEDRAVSISETLADFMDNKETGHGNGGKGQGGRGQGGQGGYGAYMRLLDKIAMADVWVMDTNSQLITIGHGDTTMNYKDIPPDASKVIEKALSGEVASGYGFSELLGVKTITVGAPVMTSGGTDISGVVLLHTSVDGISSVVKSGSRLLAISIVLALLLAGIAAVLLALHFTKPLRSMNETANQLAHGNYSVRTNIVQRDEIGELAATLDMLAGQLRDASMERMQLTQMRQDFIANISHELRTPVTVLRGSLEALCDEVVTDPKLVTEYHQQMLKDSLFLERLVNDLLELSRLQNTNFAIEKTEINLCDIIRDAIRSMTHIAQKADITLSLQLEVDSYKISGDYGRIRQMLLILLDNAIKFSIIDSTVFLHLYRNDKGAVLSVTNTGVTIAPDELPHIFERFYKSRNLENKGGSGLGLPIANQIALRHGFLLEVESVFEETTFRIVIDDETDGDRT